MGKIFRTLHYAVLIALSAAMLSCSKDSTDNPTPPGPTPPPPTHEDEAINKKMDSYLKERYLWNEDYKKLTPNFAQSYESYLPSLLLNQMTTNIYDRKSDGQGGYYIYSNIQRTSPIMPASQSTRGVNHGIEKEAQISFGIVAMTIAGLNEARTEFAFVVGGVYPGSPAMEAGIKRGFIIEKINDKVITDKNYIDLYYSITDPNVAGDISLTDLQSGKVTNLTSKSLFTNPVLLTKMFTHEATKIGYIVYQGFDAAYDDELLAAIKTLKDAGANEMILDLRMNGGGHVITSNMLSTCIAGAVCNNKVYQYFSYNAARMANPSKTSAETGNPYDAGKKYFYEDFYYGDYFSVDLTQYALNMTRLYVLVSSGTASASEAVINGLQGIDISVTIIGDKTSGKNVGMETVRLKDDRYNYLFAPITFQGYNAKGTTVDYLGMTPDYEVKEFNNGLGDFGAKDEPLFAKAYSLITGVAPAVMETRSDLGLHFVSGALPSTDLSRQGMIQLPPAER